MTTPVESNPPAADAPPCRRSSTPMAVASLGLILAAAIAFGWPTRHGEFLNGDDYNLVLEQVFVNHPTWENAGHLLRMVHGDLYQPLPMLSFQANHAMAPPDPAGQFPVDPLVFHLTNIALHALNAALAWAVACRLCGCRRVTLLVGLLFACHPLALEPVAWITGRMILLATTFSLLLMLIMLRRPTAGRGAWSYAAALAWLGALLSKVLPSVPLAAAWCDVRAGRPRDRRWWLTLLLLLEMTGAATLFAIHTTREFGASSAAEAEATTSAPVRMLLAGRYYLENYVRPTRLTAWSPPPQHVLFLSTKVMIGLAEWAALFAIAWTLRRKIPSAWTGLVLFVILLAPFLAATTARRFLTADRYMYLPMVGLHLMTASLFIGLIDAMARRIGRTFANLTAAAGATVLLAFFMVTGWNQARVWSGIIEQARHTKSIHPHDVDAHVQWVKALLQRGKNNEALQEISAGLAQWPHEKTWQALQGEALLENGDAAGAIEPLLQAEANGQNLKRVRYKLGLALDKAGRGNEARCRYLTILTADPHFLPAWTALARNYRAAGMIDFAARAYSQALAINPRHRRSLKELADVYIAEHNWPAAAKLLEQNLALDPNDDAAMLNLAIVQRYLGKPDEALERFNRLLAAHPDATSVRINRAGLLASMGRTAEAESDYRAVLTRSPDDRSALIAYHELLQQQHRYRDLVDLWETVRARSPNDSEVAGWLVFSRALDGQISLMEAKALTGQIPGDAMGRSLSEWATAYVDLAAGHLEVWPSYIKINRFKTIPPLMRQEQGRVVVVALSDLPETTRNSPSGVCALVAALVFKGDIDTARGAMTQLQAMPDSDFWVKRAQYYLDAAARID